MPSRARHLLQRATPGLRTELARIICAMPTPAPHPSKTSGKPAHSPQPVCQPRPPLATFCASRPQRWQLSLPGHNLSGWALGEPGGEAWLVLHGGPGGTAQPGLLAPFSASHHWAWAPQQRGTGPLARGRAGRWHVDMLVADLEALRHALGLSQWSVLGGSWGAMLALAYVRQHPQAVRRVVLRGAFTGTQADVWGLLRQVGNVRKRSRRTGMSPPQNRLHLPAWLARVQRVLRNATVATGGAATTHPMGHPANHITRSWLLAEQQLATHGAKAAMRHSGAHTPDQRVALRRTWAQLHHGLRLAQAQHRMQHPPTSAQRRKVALQARVLGRDCCRSLHGAWPDWQAWLASGTPTPSNTPRLTLVHGRFDAVCAPANTRWLTALGNGGTKVPTHWVHSGHLAHEPAMHTALRATVAVTAGAKAQP